MLASEAHGTPFGKFAFGAVCCVPVEVSITVPCIATAAPAAVEVRGLYRCFAGSFAYTVDLAVVSVKECQVAVCDSECGASRSPLAWVA